jgi:hypothetical protein
MTISNQYHIKLIRNIKGISESSFDFSIPIINYERVQIGRLRPIDIVLSKNPEVIDKLTKWRRMFTRYFLTQFQPSIERTADWLNKVVIPSDDRLLFLICDMDDRIIGNFGICNLRNSDAELDNLIRGERGGDPNLILFAEIALLKWLYFSVHIESALLHVFSNNGMTISLHSSVGFLETKRYDLRKIQVGDEIKYSIGTEGKIADFQYIEMRLSREEFQWKHQAFVTGDQ